MTVMRSLAILLAFAAVACGERAGPPPPPAGQESDATGYYCGMQLAGHDGPKAQIWLKSRTMPLWFTSARDAVIFTRLPEEPRDIAAFYVHDMERAASWAQPGDAAFTDGRRAFYVINSHRAGGMGAPETVPFARREAAEAFAAAEGGDVVTFEAIPDTYLFGGGHQDHGTEADAT